MNSQHTDPPDITDSADDQGLANESVDSQDPPETDKPALTITIQSWATPLIGLVMLAIGLLAGYNGRPLLNPPETAVATGTNSPPPTAAPTQSTASNQTGRQAALMEALIPKTMHFKGDPNAPVTLIEFSDFQ